MSAFLPAHPVLNHRPVRVTALLMRDIPTAHDEEAMIDWDRLTLDERLELERLLAKACHAR